MRYFVTGERTLVPGGPVETVATETAARTASETASDVFFIPSNQNLVESSRKIPDQPRTLDSNALKRLAVCERLV